MSLIYAKSSEFWLLNGSGQTDGEETVFGVHTKLNPDFPFNK